MAFYGNGFRLVTQGQTLVISAVSADGGQARTLYTDQLGASPVTLPLTVAADTTFYCEHGSYSLTIALPDGTDVSRGVLCTSRVIANVAPIPSGAQAAAIDSKLSGTYAPLVVDWATGKTYVVGQLVANAGTLYRTTTAHTAGASFTAGNFAAIGGGGGASTLPALVRTVTVAFAATVTPNADTTDVLNIGALTAAITIANPTGTPVDGQKLTLRLQQDAVGARAITWGAAFAFGSDVTLATIPGSASAKWEQVFEWNATDARWRAVAIVRGF